MLYPDHMMMRIIIHRNIFRGLLKVGKVPESTEAKATNMSLTLSAAKLGKKAIALDCYSSVNLLHQVQVVNFKSEALIYLDLVFIQAIL